MFRQRRNLSDTKELKMYGRNLQVKDKVKWLGAILDKRLSIGFHMEMLTTKATQVLWACMRTVDSTQELKPKMVHWLYTSDLVASKLSKLQKLASLEITGLTTTNTVAIVVPLDLPRLHLNLEPRISYRNIMNTI